MCLIKDKQKKTTLKKNDNYHWLHMLTIAVLNVNC